MLLTRVQAALLAGIIAIIYSEILFSGTRMLYRKGLLLRYYPLPRERNAFVSGLSTPSLHCPTS